MYHALTVDVEDYYHVSAFADTIDRSDWDRQPARVERNTYRLLDLFDDRQTRATFFVLGWVAERCGALVREIARRGHEVACHGYSHQLVFNQTPEVFQSETVRAKALLEDTIGAAVKGYRAASYSVTRRSLWALDIIAEAGFEYDSSIFPVRHDRYGMPGAPERIHVARTEAGNEVIEFPLTSARVFKWRLPVAGGGYFRIYPYPLTRALLNHSIREIDQPFIFYLHPWEIDTDQPRVNGAPWLSRFRHYVNLSRCEPRLKKLLGDFRFTTVSGVLAQQNGEQPPPVFDYGQ